MRAPAGGDPLDPLETPAPRAIQPPPSHPPEEQAALTQPLSAASTRDLYSGLTNSNILYQPANQGSAGVP